MFHVKKCTSYNRHKPNNSIYNKKSKLTKKQLFISNFNSYFNKTFLR